MNVIALTPCAFFVFPFEMPPLHLLDYSLEMHLLDKTKLTYPLEFSLFFVLCIFDVSFQIYMYVSCVYFSMYFMIFPRSFSFCVLSKNCCNRSLDCCIVGKMRRKTVSPSFIFKSPCFNAHLDSISFATAYPLLFRFASRLLPAHFHSFVCLL